jgi:hypothetical protein
MLKEFGSGHRQAWVFEQDGDLISMHYCGYMLTFEQWIALRDGVDRFYRTLSDDQVELHNNRNDDSLAQGA